LFRKTSDDSELTVPVPFIAQMRLFALGGNHLAQAGDLTIIEVGAVMPSIAFSGSYYQRHNWCDNFPEQLFPGFPPMFAWGKTRSNA
jgi:hypothetical protein